MSAQNADKYGSIDMKGIIYAIKNIKSGKIYIGQTINKLPRRVATHLKPTNRNNLINSDLIKYGRNSFVYGIICEIEAETKFILKDYLDKAEAFFIHVYMSYQPSIGYNKTFGGNGSKMTAETKIRFSKSKLGIKNHFYGKSGALCPAAKAVIQYDKAGNFVREFVTATEAGKQTGISQKNISSCCTGTLNNAGGYVWKHKE